MTSENTVSGILITGTADNDSIINFGDDVTIASGSAHAQIGIANNGAGADLTIKDDALTKIIGLESGYSILIIVY